jgi:hypothetical protein
VDFAFFTGGGRLAYKWGHEAMAEFTAGVAEGMTGFMDIDCQLVGETRRANNYEFLLMAWPEIKEMQEANPPITRNGFYEWVPDLTRHIPVTYSVIEEIVEDF